MSGWKKEDFARASFAGIPFECINTADGFKKRIVKHDLPFKNGTLIEDLGLSSPSVTLTAAFMGKNYPSLKKFIAALEKAGAADLVHPVMGTFTAVAESADVTHDDRAYYAEVRITFVLTDKADTPVTSPPASAAMKEMGIGDSIAATLAAAGDALDKKLAPLTSGVHNAMAQINAVKGAAQALVNKASAPFKLVSSLIAFGTSLPGQLLGTFAGAIVSAAGAYRAALDAPGAFTRSLKNGLRDFEAALQGFNPPAKPGDHSPASAGQRGAAATQLTAAWRVVAASAVVKAAALELAADEALEQGFPLNLASRGGDGALSPGRLMTMPEIDALAADAREETAAAIAAAETAFGPQAWPVIAGLEKQALLLQEAADTGRLRRERLVTHEVQSPTSIWLLSFKLYGSVEQVDRLMLVNAIPAPNFIPAGRELTVYA